MSTLDLFSREMVLLSEDVRWIDLGREIAARLSLPLAAVFVNAELEFPLDARFCECFSVGAAGAVLIRPDGIIAWRSADFPSDAAAALEVSLKTSTACIV